MFTLLFSTEFVNAIARTHFPFLFILSTMSKSSPNLHRLPPPVRAALQLTAHYLTRQALLEVLPETSAAELRSVLRMIRESISCQTLLEELPPAHRQVLQGRDLPLLASELAHARIQGGEISTYSETLPDHERFLHGDPVWIPLQTKHALRGLTAIFLHYTDPRIDHIQRQARIRLAGEGYETTLVRPELLAFAPEQREPEAVVEEYPHFKHVRR